MAKPPPVEDVQVYVNGKAFTVPRTLTVAELRTKAGAFEGLVWFDRDFPLWTHGEKTLAEVGVVNGDRLIETPCHPVFHEGRWECRKSLF
eukprot:m.476635 g.476635  ORF g.476635 m.476635 type:complete len:90 (-) comp20599_c0_seq1:116-385(-)